MTLALMPVYLMPVHLYIVLIYIIYAYIIYMHRSWISSCNGCFIFIFVSALGATCTYALVQSSYASYALVQCAKNRRFSSVCEKA